MIWVMVRKPTKRGSILWPTLHWLWHTMAYRIKHVRSIACKDSPEYSDGHISWHELFLAGNPGKHQILVPSSVSLK